LRRRLGARDSRFFGCPRRLLVRRRRHWRLDHDDSRGWRDHNNRRTRRGSDMTWRRSTCRSLGDHGTGRRVRDNGRRRRRMGDDGRRRSGLGNDAARLWTRGGRSGGHSSGHSSGRGNGDLRRRLDDRSHRRFCRSMAVTRFLLFLLLSQNSLQHVTGLGDMREVNFRRNRLLGARGRSVRVAGGACPTGKIRAYFLRLVLLERTGVGLAVTQPDLRQHLKNLPALDFHLARQIVNSNLTHPPLFAMCYPKPLTRS